MVDRDTGEGVGGVVREAYVKGEKSQTLEELAGPVWGLCGVAAGVVAGGGAGGADGVLEEAVGGVEVLELPTDQDGRAVSEPAR